MARRLIDRNRKREARRQVLLLDRLTRQFRGRLERELAEAMRDMVEKWEITHEVMMPRGFHERMAATYQQMTTAAVSAFGGRILDQGKSAGLILERKEDYAQTMRRLALQYVQQESIRRRITDVTETTRRQIVNAVDAGYRGGVGTAEIGRNIRGIVDGLAAFRADMIARTETHGAANYGSDSAAKLTGLPLKREWLAANDERTRESHAEADGQIVGPDEAFDVGGVLLMYPGDPSGPGSEVINCRCTLGYLVDDGLDDATDPAPGLVEAPPPAPAPRFAYETALMPNTAEEADRFVLDNRLALNTRFAGMKITAMQGAFRAAMEVTERFDLQPLTGIGPSTRFGLRPIKNALAAVVKTKMFDKGVVRNVSILHLPVKFGDLKEYERNRTSAIKSAPYYRKQAVDDLQKLEAAGKADPRVLSAFTKLGNDDYSWTYDALLDPSEHGRVTIYHEYGHVLHLIDNKIGAEINDFLARERPRSAGWQYLVSKYGGTNDKEYIAETFSIYMHAHSSQWYRIHPELLKIYQKLDKRK